MTSTTAAPVLSTPDSHILEETETQSHATDTERLSDEQVRIRYEIQRTVREIREHKWQRVALQFPDHMLQHSARVYQLLAAGLVDHTRTSVEAPMGISEQEREVALDAKLSDLELADTFKPVKLTILADTSYGSCCVDEIAAEHVDADAAVHYGRACLSPTARLPVIHVFTKMDLNLGDTFASFDKAFPDRSAKVIVTADPPYASHVPEVVAQCRVAGYTSIFEADLIHDPSSAIPNRTVPEDVKEDVSKLQEWSLFHISDPPTSLLLALSSRMSNLVVYPTTTSSNDPIPASTSMLLRRRYALVTSLTTVSIWGILVNTLSVKNYINMVSHIKSRIAAARKKSYLFVVGKINAAKVANFSEIGGWVVIGCWESSLIDSKDFYKPVITPFELNLALQRDEDRLWTGHWRSDFDSTLKAAAQRPSMEPDEVNGDITDGADGEDAEESDSDPPEFDLRTGRYISRSRPMQKKATNSAKLLNGDHAHQSNPSTALTKTGRKDLIAVNGIASPAAEYLATRRTWKGLGSDFEIKYEEDEYGSVIEEGRTGIASGYTVGESERA